MPASRIPVKAPRRIGPGGARGLEKVLEVRSTDDLERSHAHEPEHTGRAREPRGVSTTVIVSRVYGNSRDGRPEGFMILALQGLIHDAIVRVIERQYGLADVPGFTVEVPPTRALGDLAVAVAFQLARPLRKAPRAIAQEIATGIGSLPGVARIVVAPNGYLNLYLERGAFLLSRLRLEVPAPTASADKTIVEHTAINPNKAAHIGHLRNAALGDTLARVLHFRDTPIEVQNYIDDTGVQVADVIVGFRELEHLTLADVRHLTDTTRFDYYCWDLYSRVTDWYEGDKDRLAIRAAALHELERDGGEVADMGALIVN